MTAASTLLAIEEIKRDFRYKAYKTLCAMAKKILIFIRISHYILNLFFFKSNRPTFKEKKH